MILKICFTTVLLLAISRTSKARSGIQGVITPTANTDWGDWGDWEYCPDGQWVDWYIIFPI
jgi:hypothetical protein